MGKGIPYKQENLIKKVLGDWANRKLVKIPSGRSQEIAQPTEQTWQNWIDRAKSGTMSDSKQQEILKALGYVIERERTWVMIS